MDLIKAFWTQLDRKHTEARLLRDEGREEGDLLRAVAYEALRSGKAWPTVMEDSTLRITTVPQTYEGLLAFIASWDSLLLDEELAGMRAVVSRMVPMGLKYQEPERQRRAALKAEMENIRVHQPERYERMQGWKV